MEKISLYIRETLDITYSLLHMFLWGAHSFKSEHCNDFINVIDDL